MPSILSGAVVGIAVDILYIYTHHCCNRIIEDKQNKQDSMTLCLVLTGFVVVRHHVKG